jgi:hypothetical protein
MWRVTGAALEAVFLGSFPGPPGEGVTRDGDVSVAKILPRGGSHFVLKLCPFHAVLRSPNGKN